MLIVQQERSDSTTQLFDLQDRGLLLADGLFDTSLIKNGHMILKNKHVDRLLNSAERFGIPVRPSNLLGLIDQVTATSATGVLRITVTRGPLGRGADLTSVSPPTIILSLSDWRKDDAFQPITLQTSSILRNPSSPASQHKTLAYTDNVLALRAAQKNDYDNALFVNSLGNVCCAATGNVFFKMNGVWLTPPLRDGVLAGTMRQWLLEEGASFGFNCIEATLPKIMLAKTERAFLTNSVKLANPIDRIDTHRLQPELPDRLQAGIQALLEDKR